MSFDDRDELKAIAAASKAKDYRVCATSSKRSYVPICFKNAEIQTGNPSTQNITMSNLNLNRWRISRRQVLRGLGATIALPLLDCMAVAAPAPSKPKRSVFLYIPNGVNTLTWQIEKAGADYEFTKPLQSLEKHRADITPISGLHHPMVLGKHHNCEKVWLTGANVPGDGGAFRNTVSADQLIAEVQGVATRFSSLEMAIEGASLAWSRDGIQIPAERNTQQIFNMLFGVEKDSKETIRRRLSRRGSILDLVADDAKRVNNKLGQRRPQQARRIPHRRAPGGGAHAPRRRVAEHSQARSCPPTRPRAFSASSSMAEAGEYYRLFYDLMVMALRTDSTRVITCGIGSEGNASGIPEIGILQTRHGLSHHNGDPEQLRRLTETDTFLVEQFSYFLDQLKAHQEEDQHAARHHAGALGQRHGLRPQPRQRQPAHHPRRRQGAGLQARHARRFQPAEDRPVQRRRRHRRTTGSARGPWTATPASATCC